MNKIQKYFRYRQSLIDQYLKGDMTKREYLQMNYNAVVHNDIGPFRYIDTVEKGLYNYQYYNALAKEMKSVSTSYGIDYDAKRDYQSQADYYYSKKDRATMKVLNSTNEKILNDLRQEGVFSEGTRISLIDGYVNQRY